MKRIFIYIVLCFIAFEAFAQQTIKIDQFEPKNEVQTVFKREKRDGFYVGSSIAYSPIDNADAVAVAARMGWIMDRWFAFGLAGTAFVNNFNQYSESFFYPSDVVYLAGAYGGFFVEPILMPLKPVHLSFPIIVGGGGALSFRDYYYTSPEGFSEDMFFVVEPGVELEVNFTRWMRVGVFATYRYTSEINIDSVDKNALSKYSAGLSLKIGWF